MTKRILVIDDDRCVRETISLLLGQMGHECHSVANGVEALELLKSEEKFALVTSDVHNAPMDGPTFLEQIKTNFPDVPVLMITANNDRSTVLECFRKGACEYLLKPFGRTQLHAAVHRVFNADQP